MEAQSPNPPAAAPAVPRAVPTYQSLPPEVEQEPRMFSLPFILFAVLIIGGAAIAGALQSGKIDLNRLFKSGKPAAQTATAGAKTTAAAAPAAQAPGHSFFSNLLARAKATPAPPLKPGAFVVTSISLGESSFAIINGVSHSVGDAVNAPGVTGWKVSQINDGVVVLQNGPSLASIPLTEPGLKPIDDSLHPLN